MKKTTLVISFLFLFFALVLLGTGKKAEAWSYSGYQRSYYYPSYSYSYYNQPYYGYNYSTNMNYSYYYPTSYSYSSYYTPSYYANYSYGYPSYYGWGIRAYNEPTYYMYY
jgi:hypothetical protein